MINTDADLIERARISRQKNVQIPDDTGTKFLRILVGDLADALARHSAPLPEDVAGLVLELRIAHNEAVADYERKAHSMSAPSSTIGETLWSRAASLIASQAREIERLHERLEDNREYDSAGARIDVPPGSIPDGIECRNETIKLQDERIKAQAQEIEHRAREEFTKGLNEALRQKRQDIDALEAKVAEQAREIKRFQKRVHRLLERDKAAHSALKHTGVCMSCVYGLQEPCTDCMGTGWVEGQDHVKRAEAAEARVRELEIAATHEARRLDNICDALNAKRDAIEAATIERCAKVADNCKIYSGQLESARIANGDKEGGARATVSASVASKLALAIRALSKEPADAKG